MEKITIKEKVMKELKRMGFNFGHIGTTYLVDAIQIIYNSKNPEIIKCLEKNVYTILAKKYCKKDSTIKSDITKATNYMNDQTLMQKKKTDEYYNLYPKMTAKSVINTIILKLNA